MEIQPPPIRKAELIQQEQSLVVSLQFSTRLRDPDRLTLLLTASIAASLEAENQVEHLSPHQLKVAIDHFKSYDSNANDKD
jgi:hypothetical protein